MLFLKIQKYLPGIRGDVNWDVSSRNFFHQSELTILTAEAIDKHEQRGPQQQDHRKADEYVDATDIHYREHDEQQNQPCTEIPDVLCLQPFKLDGPVNAFVNTINTCCHCENF
jgi:hypothetical protein